MSLTETIRQAAAMVARTHLTAFVYQVGPAVFEFTAAPRKGSMPVLVVE